MNIKWNITKKRGNVRPVLTYTIVLDEHEKALALPPLRLTSEIPEPEESWQEHCYPGQYERSQTNTPWSTPETLPVAPAKDTAATTIDELPNSLSASLSGNSPVSSPRPTPDIASGKFHELEIPSHKGHSWTHSLRLPWREDNSYPEVEKAFRVLRDAFEKELAAAYSSLPLREENSLQTSANAKAGIAPGVLAERFLQLAKGNMRKAG